MSARPHPLTALDWVGCSRQRNARGARGERVNFEPVRRTLALCGILASLAVPAAASGQEPAPTTAPAGAEALPPDTHIEIAPQPTEAKPLDAPSDVGPEGLVEAPPPRPRRKGLVLESTLGVLGFAGQFRHIAPPAYWLHALLGYEAFDWLMVFGEGELAFTDTSESQDPSHTKAFPLWGFGGGARATFHATPRFAAFVQGEIDALAADVPHNALTVLGFRNAETLAPSFGARIGVDWYQIDRHLALTAQVGARDATGFAKVVATSDTPIMWDGALGLSYTF